MTDPRTKPGGRHHYGPKPDLIAELRAAGVLHNDHGPVEKQPLPVLRGMVEKVRQRAGFLSVARWSRGRAVNMTGWCAICGGYLASVTGYCTGRTQGGEVRRAHPRCVASWRREQSQQASE